MSSVYSYEGKELPQGILSTLSNVPQTKLAEVLLWIMKNTRTEAEHDHSWYWVPHREALEDIPYLSPDLGTILKKVNENLTEENDSQLILFYLKEKQDYLLAHQGGKDDIEFHISEDIALEYLDFVKDKLIYNVYEEQVPCPIEYSVPL